MAKAPRIQPAEQTGEKTLQKTNQQANTKPAKTMSGSKSDARKTDVIDRDYVPVPGDHTKRNQ